MLDSLKQFINDHGGSLFANLLLPLCGWCMAFTTDIHTLMVALTFLIAVDLVGGIWAAKKEGQKITSFGLRKTVSKTLVYQGAVITSFVVGKYLLTDYPVLKATVTLLSITELKSLTESFERITGLPLWKTILAKIQGDKNMIPPKDR